MPYVTGYFKSWKFHFLSLLLLLGCGGGASDERKIVIWHQTRPDEQAVLQAQIARYKKLHPDVTIV